MAVGVRACVDAGFLVAVTVWVRVAVAVGHLEAVTVGVLVAVAVPLAVAVGVPVELGVGVLEGVSVGVGKGVPVQGHRALRPRLGRNTNRDPSGVIGSARDGPEESASTTTDDVQTSTTATPTKSTALAIFSFIRPSHRACMAHRVELAVTPQHHGKPSFLG